MVDHLFVWIVEPDRVVGALCWLAACYSIAGVAAARRSRRLERAIALALGLAVGGVALAFALAVADQPRDAGHTQEAVAELAAEALDRTRITDHPVLLRSTAQLDARSRVECCRATLAVLLTRAGVDVVVEAGAANRFGDHRAHPERAETELLISSQAGARHRETRRGYTLVGRADPLAGAERDRLTRIDHDLDRLLGPAPSLEEIATAQRNDLRVTRLYAERARIDDLPQLELWARAVAGDRPLGDMRR